MWASKAGASPPKHLLGAILCSHNLQVQAGQGQPLPPTSTQHLITPTDGCAHTGLPSPPSHSQVQADRDQLLSSTSSLQEQLQATREAAHTASNELKGSNSALQLAQVRALLPVYSVL